VIPVISSRGGVATFELANRRHIPGHELARKLRPGPIAELLPGILSVMGMFRQLTLKNSSTEAGILAMWNLSRKLIETERDLVIPLVFSSLW
jgi:allophanate hydrolase subunit 1